MKSFGNRAGRLGKSLACRPRRPLRNCAKIVEIIRAILAKMDWERAMSRRRSVVRHFSFLPEENAFTVQQPSVYAFTVRHTGVVFT